MFRALPSVPAWSSALIAALVGFGGTIALVVEAMRRLGASAAETGSAITALCVDIPKADVIPYQPRHGVIVERRNVMHWLDGTLSNAELFAEQPRHTLFVEPLRAQASLALLLRARPGAAA